MILPAFGITVELLETLVSRGCTLVDTTCGSVLNVWKNVKRYAERGLHLGHSRQVLARGDAGHGVAGAAGRRRPLPRRARPRRGGAGLRLHPRRRRSREHFLQHVRARRVARLRPRPAPPAGRLRQPDDDAQLGVARNRRDVPARDARPVRRRASSTARFRAFDTICSATQDRQDAVIALLDEQPLDLMIVIGGYNSSNTCNLARICAERLPDLSHRRSRGPGVGSGDPAQAGRAASTRDHAADWLPAGPVAIGLTSGASTPDNLVERVIRRLDTLANGGREDSEF